VQDGVAARPYYNAVGLYFTLAFLKAVAGEILYHNFVVFHLPPRNQFR
jgi:hypothetical protein